MPHRVLCTVWVPINVGWVRKRSFVKTLTRWPAKPGNRSLWARGSALWGGGAPEWLSPSFLSPLLLDDPPHPPVQGGLCSFPSLQTCILPPHSRHYHPVKQRGQSGSIWITLTIAYYLAETPPNSPPLVPTAAALNPEEPCLPSPHPWSRRRSGDRLVGCPLLP